MVFTALLAVPLGIAAALYLEEFADHARWWNRFIEVNLQNLAAVPPSSTACWPWPSWR